MVDKDYKRFGSSIQTYRGKAFYPLDPRGDEIDINDIAHSLAQQCRFTGHTNEFSSIAQHSVLVSRLCDPQDALWGLLHDASEAYLHDIPGPLKRLPFMAEYRKVEEKLQRMIVEKYGLAWPQPESVTRADEIMLGIEARDQMWPLLKGVWDNWLALIGDCKVKMIEPWTSEKSEDEFLQLFWALYGAKTLEKAA